MTKELSFKDIRREYGDLRLDESSMPDDPLVQFHAWFAAILQSDSHDPTAAVLSTVDRNGRPDSRVILLKEVANGSFLFYTNYHSAKAQQLEASPYAALNFYWPQMARQIRIRGQVNKVAAQQSDAYFASRPYLSQLGALASRQSCVIASREVLESQFKALQAQYGEQHVERPEHWGGYALIPDEFEFWQGRDNRLHDRIQYLLKEGRWVHHRLAP